MNTPLKVLIADDHAIVRNGIIALLINASDISIIAESTSSADLFEKLRDGLEPDIVIAELHMRAVDGISLTRQLIQQYPHIKIIILTTVDDENIILKCFEAGARGYLLKNVNAAEIIFAIKQISFGYEYISASIGIRLLAQIARSAAPLTSASLKLNISKREIEILGLIAEGLTNGEIAEKMFTSKRTIEGNRQNLLDKTGKRNTAALITFAVRNGIID
ncbi:response regulator transcription factor [Pedobacter endophyticus]|uniref:Response regulator transcription factor n=1 Tax=Pedobacter endophyticus TaxID=2789740 RepID=A0A7S9Q162_9SPHI|nr:response regulator transcription factor [Pedobacter endophyticus]QPH41437.1 response regulator transcription factor [Pedobacter endophyticus]